MLAGAIKRKSSGGEKDKKKPIPAAIAKDGQVKSSPAEDEAKVQENSKADNPELAENAAKKRKVAG